MDSGSAPVDIDPHLRKFQKELAAGSVALVLLAVLGRSQRPLYGYEIAKHLEREGEAPVAGKQSALYPVLRNLHAAGLLDSHVEPSVAGPPRRYYEATALGRAVLAEWTRAWHSTRAFVDQALAG
jgi:PadR family transcriptional regulator, regulatory protein PadR